MRFTFFNNSSNFSWYFRVFNSKLFSFSCYFYDFVLIWTLEVVFHVHATRLFIKLIFNFLKPNRVSVLRFWAFDVASVEIRSIGILFECDDDEIIRKVILKVKTLQIAILPMFGLKRTYKWSGDFLFPLLVPKTVPETEGMSKYK